MVELITLLFGSMLLLHLSQRYHPRQLYISHSGRTAAPRMDGFLALAIFWLSAFYFLRTSYNDTHNYIRFWTIAPHIRDFLASGQLLDFTGNPLFRLYESLTHSITENYHLYFLVPAFICNYAAVKTIKRYSVSPAISLMIYFCLGTYVLCMAAMKQGAAMGILMLSIPYALDKKYVRFYLLVFLATLIHVYAAVFVIVPLLLGKPWNIRTWILLGVALFALVTYRSTLGIVINYAQMVGAQASEEELFDENAINAFRVVVFWVPSILALVFRRRLFYDSTRIENLFVNLSIISSFVLMIGLAEGANLMARMAAYLEVGTMICLPWMIQKLFTKQSAQLVTTVASVCFFAYFLYDFGIAKSFDTGYQAINLWDFVMMLLGVGA